MNRFTQLLTALAVAALVGLSAPIPASAAPDSSLGVLKVSAGGTVDQNYSHTCAILSDHSMWCWGANSYGQLGDPALSTLSSEPTLLPNKVAGDHQWETFDTGEGHTCAIDTAGALWCWGADTYGQLGNNSSDFSAHATPIKVGVDSNWTGVTALAAHTCAIKSTGTIWCWGYGDTRLGLGAVGNQLVPVQVGSDNNWAAIDAGYQHTCATKRNGTLWCWGHMDPSYATQYEYPTQIGTSTDNGWVGAGGWNSCTITNTAAHTLRCYGVNGDGQGGTGSTDFLTDLTAVSGGGSWISAGLGHQHTCGVQANNTLWCWGYEGNGGLGGVGDSLVPRAAGTDHLWTAVDSGPYHSCGITTGRDLYCWGLNNYGQVGDGTTTDRYAPVLVIDGADLPSTDASTPVQRSQILAQLALLSAVCAFALRMSAPLVSSKGSRRR
jgi:alpha-tubulin suppressor-like RCC1 family protein